MNPRNELLKVIEEAMDHIALGKPELAMAPMWRIHSALRADDLVIGMKQAPVKAFDVDQAAVKAALTAEWERMQKLPPMKPVKKSKKRVRPLDVECPTCGAQPGVQCYRMTKRGFGGTPLVGEFVNHCHNPRINRARNL